MGFGFEVGVEARLMGGGALASIPRFAVFHGVIPAKAGISVCWHAVKGNRDSRFRGNDVGFRFEVGG
jgi:hypothetical protein